MAAPRFPTATTTFNKLTNNELVAQSGAIITGLGSVSGLALFPDLQVPLAAMTSTRTTYITLLAAAVDGSKEDTANMIVQKKILQGYLSRNAYYVNSVVRGQGEYEIMEQSILISGYRVSAVPAPKVTLPAPDQFTAKMKVINGAAQPGIVSLRYKRSAVQANRGYGTKWYWKTVAAATFNEISTSGASIDISGLTSGTAYVFKCVQIGNKDTIVTESDPITVNVL